MRYGIVRDVQGLLDTSTQRSLLAKVGCDVILDDGRVTPETQRRLGRLIGRIKLGDQVLVHSLDVFQQPAQDLVKLLYGLFDVGALLKVVRSEKEIHTVKPTTDVLKLLGLMSEPGARRFRRRTVEAAERRSYAGSRNPLSRYQITYARRLYRQGASTRSIGLLFQISPTEVKRYVTHDDDDITRPS